RFHLTAEARVRITLSGPPGNTVAANLQWGESGTEIARLRTTGEAGADGRSTVVWDGLLGPGDHYLPIRSNEPLDGPYAVLVELRPYFDRPADLEPNDDWWAGRPVPADLRIDGRLWPEDADWYRLPELDRPAELVIRDLEPETGTLDRSYLRIVQETPPDGSPWPSRAATAA